MTENAQCTTSPLECGLPITTRKKTHGGLTMKVNHGGLPKYRPAKVMVGRRHGPSTGTPMRTRLCGITIIIVGLYVNSIVLEESFGRNHQLVTVFHRGYGI